MQKVETMEKQDEKIIELMNKNPKLKARVISILDISNNTSGDIIKANDAEERTIEELRKLGNEVLGSWADNRVEKSTDEILEKEKENITKDGKKKFIGTQLMEK